MTLALVEAGKSINIAVEGMNNEEGDRRIRKEIFRIG